MRRLISLLVTAFLFIGSWPTAGYVVANADEAESLAPIAEVEVTATGLEAGRERVGGPRALLQEKDDDPESRFSGRMKDSHFTRIAPRIVGGYGIELKTGERLRFFPLDGANVSAKRVGSHVLYEGVWENTDIRLTVGMEELKEEIILRQPVEKNQWQFRVHTNGLELWSDPASGEVLIGKPGNDSPTLSIGDLIAVDSAGAQTPVNLSLSDGKPYIVTLSVDKTWLDDPTRKYPVVVDPTVYLVGSGITGRPWELADGTLIVMNSTKWRVSKDGGRTWLTPPNESWRPSGSGSFQSLEIGPDGIIHYMSWIPLWEGCSYDYSEEIRYWRGVLSADRLSITWVKSVQVAKICSNSSAFNEADVSVFDAGSTTYVHTAWVQISTTGSLPYYVKYRRLTVNDSTGAITAGSIVSVRTTYQHDYGAFKILADKITGHVILIYNGTPDSSGSTNPLMNSYYSVFRWSGSSYSSVANYTWCASSHSPEKYCDSTNIQVLTSADGRFRIFGGELFYNAEVTVTASSVTSRVIAEGPYVSPRALASDGSGNVWLFWGDSSGALRKRRWVSATNTWESDIIVFNPAPGGTSPLGARKGPSYNYVDLTWGNPLYFARFYYDAPGISNMDPGANGWANSVTPRFTWQFTDPNAGDTQAAFQVVIRDSGGTVRHDSGKKSSTVSAYDVPAGILADGGTYSWQLTVWDNVGFSVTSGSTTFRVDAQPPTGSLLINNGGAVSNTTSVYLTLSAQDVGSGLRDMRFSQDNVTWSAWETYTTSKWFTLANGNGTKTVYGQFRDLAGGIRTVSDTIVLDGTRPTVQLRINGGATSTVNESVTLAVDAINNPQQMRFRNESTGTWTAWEAYAGSKSWNLTPGWGQRNVYVEVLDLNGTVSFASAQIELKFEPPSNLNAWGEPDHIYLQWAASPSLRTVGYNIYRSTNPGTWYAKLNASPVTTLDYRDYTTAIGVRYYYVVRSVNSSSEESPLASNEATAVSGAYPVGTLTVTEGSISGPGGQLSLTAWSETAIQWSGIEWREQGTTAWNLQSGSGLVTPGESFSVIWSVPTTPTTYEVRVKLVDDQSRPGQTDILVLTLPAAPTVPTVETGSLGNVLVQWSGNGLAYDLERSSSASFTTVETLVKAGTATSLEMPFNGVANPSFEVAGGDGLPLKWSTLGNGSCALDGTVRDADGFSLRIQSSSATGENGVQQKVFEGPGLAGKPLTASVRVKLDSVVGTGFVLRLRFQDRAGADLTTVTTVPVLGTADWQTLQVTAWVPANTYRVYLEGILSDATGTVWVDAAQVQPEMTARTTFAPGLLSTNAYYRVRAWNGPLYNLSAPVYRTVSPFPSDLGLWAWEN